MKRKKKKSGFSFEIDPKRVVEFSKLSLVSRLQWLEEANRFIASVNNGKLLKKWQALREIDKVMGG